MLHTSGCLNRGVTLLIQTLFLSSNLGLGFLGLAVIDFQAICSSQNTTEFFALMLMSSCAINPKTRRHDVSCFFQLGSFPVVLRLYIALFICRLYREYLCIQVQENLRSVNFWNGLSFGSGCKIGSEWTWDLRMINSALSRPCLQTLFFIFIFFLQPLLTGKVGKHFRQLVRLLFHAFLEFFDLSISLC